MVTPGTRWTISGSATAGMASISFLVTTEVAAAASSRGSGTRAVTTISSRATCRESRSRKKGIILGVIYAGGSLPGDGTYGTYGTYRTHESHKSHSSHLSHHRCPYCCR